MNKLKEYILISLIIIALVVCQVNNYIKVKQKEIELEDDIKRLQEWQDSVEKNGINLR